ncbi:MAG: cytochrome C oxidase subunit IV family protein [Polyangia bacterium]
MSTRVSTSMEGSMHGGAEAEGGHLTSYATFIKVWLALVALTLGLVGLSASHRPDLILVGLLIITPAKASLVMSYFMHLRHEGAAMKLMVVAAFGVLVIFLFLTFSDYLYR